MGIHCRPFLFQNTRISSEFDRNDLFPIKEIVESDWVNWGDVRIETEKAHINIHENTAWVSTYGSLVQVGTNEDSALFFNDMMKKMLEDESIDVKTRMFEAKLPQYDDSLFFLKHQGG